MSKTIRIKQSQKIFVSGLLIVVAVLFLAPMFMDSFMIFLLTRVLFMGLAAMSLYIIMGLGNMMSFAQMAFLE